MFDLPRASFDREALRTQLKSLARNASFVYQHDGQRFFAPRSLAELTELRASHPQATILAGNTDVGLWVNKQLRELPEIIHIGYIAELREIRERGRTLRIGAGASLTDAYEALAGPYPGLREMWERFASVPIRNAGTMGGNVANGSPIGDSPPVLMALDAQIELRRGARVRRMALTDFYTDYMKNRLEPGEFVQGLKVPLNGPARAVRAYKISKRFDCDISALCAGFAIELNGDVVASVRLAYGGMAATVKRAATAEAALVGQPWSQAAVRAAQAALAQDFKPLSDMRASAAYRLQVAQNLLQRFWLETRTENPLPGTATSVFSVMPHDTGLASV